MRVITRQRFDQLVEYEDIRHEGCRFLDGIKIGLSITPTLVKMPNEINFLQAEHAGPSGSVKLSGFELLHLPSTLQRGSFYLATTREKLSLSSRIFGLLHTRSTWARVGLDCIGSSNYVSPGFGADRPTELVLEFRPLLTIQNFSDYKPLAGLLLFELDEPVEPGTPDHSVRFPLSM